jgi:ATP adenylyltransferase
MKLSQAAEQVFKEQLHCEGINLGVNLGRAAGGDRRASAHPYGARWLGDDNFMSVIGARRVIPEDFERSWERLHSAFDKLMRDKG